MSDPVYNFYRDLSLRVIDLSASPDKSWQELSKVMPLLPRGWFELSCLPAGDRIEFTRDFWLSKIPALAAEGDYAMRLEHFFDRLESIDILATQERERTPYEVHMIYSMQDQTSFFHGYPPASSDMVENMSNSFSNFDFPEDYLGFLSIHDGFSKFTDTGLIRVKEMVRIYLKFQEILAGERMFTENGRVLDPKSLIPFYEDDLHCYQCFYADDLPSQAKRNIYYSDYVRALSLSEELILDESTGFPSFLSWLTFYLE